MGTARGDGRLGEPHPTHRAGPRRTPRESAVGHARQGDGGGDEPPHRGRALPRARQTAARLARRERRRGQPQGRHDRLRLRPARLAAAHPQQAAARGTGRQVPRPEHPLQPRHRPRHVADRLRRAEPAHDVRRQADARPRPDAGDRARQPGVQGQARRAGRRLPRPRGRPQEGAGDLHRSWWQGRDGARPGRGRGADAREVRGLPRVVPRVRVGCVGHWHASGPSVSSPGSPRAHPRSGRRQSPSVAHRHRALAGVRVGRAA